MTEPPKGTVRDYGKRTRREKILRSAQSLFRENGYQRTGTKDVAEHAGVAEPTVYNHFGSKSGLVVEIIRHSDAELQTQIDELINASTGDMVSEMSKLLSLFVESSLNSLDRSTWRDVIAFSVLESEMAAGIQYAKLNADLYENCSRLLLRWDGMGLIGSDLNVEGVRALLERQNHGLFRDLVLDRIDGLEEYRRILRSSIEAIFFGSMQLPTSNAQDHQKKQGK